MISLFTTHGIPFVHDFQSESIANHILCNDHYESLMCFNEENNTQNSIYKDTTTNQPHDDLLSDPGYFFNDGRW